MCDSLNSVEQWVENGKIAALYSGCISDNVRDIEISEL
jgi:hypothetical protein